MEEDRTERGRMSKYPFGCITAVPGTGQGQTISPRADAILRRYLAHPSYLLVPDLSNFLPNNQQPTPCPLCSETVLQLEREPCRQCRVFPGSLPNIHSSMALGQGSAERYPETSDTLWDESDRYQSRISPIHLPCPKQM